MTIEPALLVDIGGTNTRVARSGPDGLERATIARFNNAEHPGLTPILHDYMARAGITSASGLVVALAGPVTQGRGDLTNLDWILEEEALAEVTGANHVGLLNDMQAMGFALGHLSDSNLTQIRAGTLPPDPAQARVVLNVGTGFNAAAVHEVNGQRFVPASECGHINLPARTDADLRLCAFVEKHHGFPAIEDVLSGRGLERIYQWLAAEAGETGEKTAAEVMSSPDADMRAYETIQAFARILGTVSGNQALIHLPFGGIYLVGGVARAMSPWLKGAAFEDAFTDKGRFGDLVANFSIWCVDDDYAALVGCDAFLKRLRNGGKEVHSA